jgi:GntR family transcriptional regulator
LKPLLKENESPFNRLQRELGERIASAKAGDRLPPEPELARSMGVSRSTLREAMRSFEAQGLLIRRQGAGTFVVEKNGVFETGLEVLESLETIAERSGLQVSMGGLQVEELEASAEIARTFTCDEGDAFVRVTRVINSKERPVAFLRDTLPQNVLSLQGLNGGFTGSVLDLLIKRKNSQLGMSHTEIQAVAANSEAARALKIQRGDVLLLLEANLHSQKGEVIDHSQSYFLPGYFRFYVNRKIGII